MSGGPTSGPGATAELAFVIPAYNAATTIGETVRGLLAQQSGAWEAVVVDDGSIDETARVVLQAADGDRRVRLVRQENRGVSAARNAGLARVKARAVCFLDADDVPEAGFMHVMLGALRGGGGHDGVACSYRFMGNTVVQRAAAGQYTDRALREGIFAPPGARVFDRGALERMTTGGRAVFSEDFRVCADWEMLVRLSLTRAQWRTVDEPLLLYRRHAGAMSARVGPMWREGGALVRTYGKDAGALRRWDLRCLALCLAQGVTGEAEEIRAACGSVSDPDVDAMTGALRWAVAAADGTSAWRERVVAVLGRVGEELARRVDTGWEAIVAATARQIGERDILAIYGLGRNGHTAAAAARELGVPAVGVDDDPAAVCDLPRVRPEDLGDRHVVLVTPDERTGILARLTRLGVRRVVCPGRASLE